MVALIQRHADRIVGTLSCFDRVIITGTLPEICHAEAMASYLRVRGIRLFDYTQFAQPLREQIRANAERLANENHLQIEFIRRKNFRKEERIKEIITHRGDQPGLVHIFSAMESCPSFIPWHDKTTGKTFLRSAEAKCLHYYFYFIDAEWGLCSMRVPTWAPFRLQFYFNGHQALAKALDRQHLTCALVDNAFVDIEDFAKAQRLADSLSVERLHRKLDTLAKVYCSATTKFSSGYHWSVMQVEYATDIIFASAQALAPVYEAISRTAIHTVKPDHIATFLGRKLTPPTVAELGTDFHTRIEGTSIKHHFGPVSIKLYRWLHKCGHISYLTASPVLGEMK